MKHYRYEVDSNTGKWAAGPFESWLNERSKKGWRLVTVFWTAHHELFCVFEKEATDETPTV